MTIILLVLSEGMEDCPKSFLQKFRRMVQLVPKKEIAYFKSKDKKIFKNSKTLLRHKNERLKNIGIGFWHKCEMSFFWMSHNLIYRVIICGKGYGGI